MPIGVELPLKHVGEPLVLSREGTCSDVFEIDTGSGNKVYKEVRESSRILSNFHGATLEERAAKIDRLYTIVKKHLGDYFVKPDILIAKNEHNQPCIMLVQDKVDGVTPGILPRTMVQRLPNLFNILTIKLIKFILWPSRF